MIIRFWKYLLLCSLLSLACGNRQTGSANEETDTASVPKEVPQASVDSVNDPPKSLLEYSSLDTCDGVFEGSYEEAYAFNPIVHRYVPAIAKVLREQTVPHVRVRYEDVVADPSRELERINEHLELPHEEEAIDYGSHRHEKGSFGDPKVEQNTRPVTKSMERWAGEVAADPSKLEMTQRIISELDPEDLAAWGYPVDEIFEPLERAGTAPAPRDDKSLRWQLNPYRLQRKVLLTLKKDIHTSHVGKAVRKVRYYCDVLLRE